MASVPGAPVVRRPVRRSRVALLDVAAVAWIIACLLLGVRVHDEVLGLKGLTVTVERVGGQLESIGGTVGDLDIPLVGEELDGVGEQAQSAGAQAQAQAREGRASVESLARLLGVAVVILAIAPVLATYLPLRVGWWREAAAERRLADRARDDPSCSASSPSGRSSPCPTTSSPPSPAGPGPNARPATDRRIDVGL